MTRTTAEDIVCGLIKWGYGSEDQILNKPLHIIMSRYRWFMKYDEEERKRQPQCPLMSNKKKGKNNK